MRCSLSSVIFDISSFKVINESGWFSLGRMCRRLSSLQDLHVGLSGHRDRALTSLGSSQDISVSLTCHIISLATHQSHLTICDSHMIFSMHALAQGNLTIARCTHLLTVSSSFDYCGGDYLTYVELRAVLPKLIGAKLPSLDASS